VCREERKEEDHFIFLAPTGLPFQPSVSATTPAVALDVVLVTEKSNFDVCHREWSLSQRRRQVERKRWHSNRRGSASEERHTYVLQSDTRPQGEFRWARLHGESCAQTPSESAYARRADHADARNQSESCRRAYDDATVKRKLGLMTGFDENQNPSRGIRPPAAALRDPPYAPDDTRPRPLGRTPITAVLAIGRLALFKWASTHYTGPDVIVIPATCSRWRQACRSVTFRTVGTRCTAGSAAYSGQRSFSSELHSPASDRCRSKARLVRLTGIAIFLHSLAAS
jgi:hypothetical protein